MNNDPRLGAAHLLACPVEGEKLNDLRWCPFCGASRWQERIDDKVHTWNLFHFRGCYLGDLTSIIKGTPESKAWQRRVITTDDLKQANARTKARGTESVE